MILLRFDVTPADYDYVLRLSLLNELIDRGFNPSVTSCSILLEKLVRSREEESGWLLFHQILDRRVDALETETFNVMMKALCKQGRLQRSIWPFV